MNGQKAGLSIDQAKLYLEKLTKIPIITVRPEGKFNLSTLEKDSDYVEPDSGVYDEYMSKISQATFPYQNSKSKTLDPQKLIDAALPMIEKSLEYHWNLQNSFVINDGEHFLTINLGATRKDTFAESGNKPLFETVTTISMHPDLLHSLTSKRKDYKGFTTMHWNQADVGSHFRWQRVGNFNLNAHMLLNFFGT